MQRKEKLVVAESCTGGMLCAAITDLPGVSKWFERGLITYSNDSKMELLQVPGDILAKKGAVSAETARAMAEGALRWGDWALAITGIAGAKHALLNQVIVQEVHEESSKPEGLVFISLAHLDAKTRVQKFNFPGNRAQIRRAACNQALQLLLEALLSR